MSMESFDDDLLHVDFSRIVGNNHNDTTENNNGDDNDLMREILGTILDSDETEDIINDNQVEKTPCLTPPQTPPSSSQETFLIAPDSDVDLMRELLSTILDDKDKNVETNFKTLPQKHDVSNIQTNSAPLSFDGTSSSSSSSKCSGPNLIEETNKKVNHRTISRRHQEGLGKIIDDMLLLETIKEGLSTISSDYLGKTFYPWSSINKKKEEMPIKSKKRTALKPMESLSPVFIESENHHYHTFESSLNYDTSDVSLTDEEEQEEEHHHQQQQQHEEDAPKLPQWETYINEDFHEPLWKNSNNNNKNSNGNNKKRKISYHHDSNERSSKINRLFGQSSSSSSSTTTPSKKSDYGPEDVLFGRGGLSNEHVGNRFFREEAQKLCGRYFEHGMTKPAKTKLRNQLIQSVFKRGGKFLRFDVQTELWVEGLPKQICRKASQALRDARKNVATDQ